MSDLHEAFLADIIADPDSDALRLIYADWLDERGQEERGEFIRLQIELAKPDPCQLPKLCCYGPNPPPERQGVPVHFCGNMECMGRSILRRREQGLLASHALEWSDPIMETGLAPAVTCFDYNVFGYGDCRWSFRRGFVEEIALPCEAWVGWKCPFCRNLRLLSPANSPSPNCLFCHGTDRVRAHGPELIKVAPLKKVRLTDKEPAGPNPAWGNDYRRSWWFGEPQPHEGGYGDDRHLRHTLPLVLLQHLPPEGFLYRELRMGWRVCGEDPRQAAADALSTALLRYAHPNRQTPTLQTQANAI